MIAVEYRATPREGYYLARDGWAARPFRGESLALRAASLSEAAALSLYHHQHSTGPRGLAWLELGGSGAHPDDDGSEVRESTVGWKAANGLPYTDAERAWLDARIAGQR